MKTQKENKAVFENTDFDVLNHDELLTIKGGTNNDDYGGGTPTVDDGEFD